MIKNLIVVLLCFTALQAFSQNDTDSPYSFYGIGSLKFKGTIENRSMGGLSIYNDSIHANLRNPATYGGKNLAIYNNESRPVIFTIGGSNNKTTLKSNSGENKTTVASFDYLSVAFPVGKLGVGFGLMPYTSVGYKLENTDEFGRTTECYDGEGGLNKTYFSLGYTLNDNFSFGITADYNFGKINNNTIVFPYNDEGELLSFNSKEFSRSDLSGFSFTLGTHYKKMVTDKLELQTGLTYSPRTNLESVNERTLSTIIINDQDQEFVLNELNVDLESRGLATTDLVIPSKFTIGAGIGEPTKWFAGVDFITQNTSKFSNPLYNYQNTTFENASTLSIGGFYIPKYNAFRGYYNRIVYRAGMRFEKTGLKINNESIKEFGISFGLGLSVGSGRDFFSNANLGFEFGQRGTTSSNLIQENFVNFQLSLSLNDRWFQKRKYD